MDLIYMNSERTDLGVLQEYDFDLAFGADENDFECRIPSMNHCCEAGCFLYIEGTEYGGTIDSIEVISETSEVIYYGRTWHGILGSKIVMPLQDGEASTSKVAVKTEDANGASLVDKYLIISGDANACIGFILERIGLSDLFAASEITSGFTVEAFQFDRFTDAYSGIIKMLDTIGLKMHVKYVDEKVLLTAVEQYDYATDEEFDPTLIDMKLKKKVRSVNHLICLGSGQQENRTVLHLYADIHGNISQTQTQTGLDEYAAIYDYSSVESEEELLKEGTKQLKELWQPDEMVINLDDTADYYDVGDRVGAYDNITGLSVSAEITKKIVNIKDGLVSVNLETDSSRTSTTTGGTGGTGGGSGSSASLEIGEGLKWVDNVLCVDATNVMEEDNTKPITSSAVFVEVGNINTLLSTI